jgi:hypothetical protein
MSFQTRHKSAIVFWQSPGGDGSVGLFIITWNSESKTKKKGNDNEKKNSQYVPGVDYGRRDLTFVRVCHADDYRAATGCCTDDWSARRVLRNSGVG